MILDTSAIVAVLLKEPGCEAMIEKMQRASSMGVGAPTLAESAIVLSARLRFRGESLFHRRGGMAALRQGPASRPPQYPVTPGVRRRPESRARRNQFLPSFSFRVQSHSMMRRV